MGKGGLTASMESVQTAEQRENHMVVVVVKIRGYIRIMEKKMETTINGYIGFNIGLYGWLSKSWSLVRYPKD